MVHVLETFTGRAVDFGEGSWRVVLLALLTLSVGGVDTASGDTTVLENEQVRLEMCEGPAPYIGRLVHRASGAAVVDHPEDTDCFEIVLAGGDGGPVTLRSGLAQKSKIDLQSTGQGKVLVVRWSNFPGAELVVTATGRCLAGEPLVAWSMEVQNRSGKAVTSVRFPMVTAVSAIGNSEDDFLVLPSLPGTRIDNPLQHWPNGYRVALSFPGQLSAQFLAWQDQTAGVYLAGRDGGSHPMELAVARRPKGFRLWHRYTPLDGTATAWKSPYDVVVGVTQGSWQDSADLYKCWAVKQPWCEKTLVQREDIPKWWKEGPGVHVCAVRTYGADRICTGSYYPELPEHMRSYREKIDGAVVPMLADWENHRRWTAGDYFPVFDQSRARRVIGELRGEGFRPFWFLSGLFSTYNNEGANGSPVPAAEKYLDHYVVDGKTGKPQTFILNESSRKSAWRRKSYEFCVGDPATTEFFLQVVDRAHELGVDVLQMDQTVSGAGHACYSKGHQHAPGVGLYQTRGFQQLLQAMRRRGKENSPEFVLFHEEPHEQLIPCLDGFHVREYKEKWWYRGYPGSIGIPLFSYLYHEYAIGYGGDSAVLHPSGDRRMVRNHAVNLVTGRTPGGSVWTSQQNMRKAHPDQFAILRGHCRLLKSRAREFLMLGRMLHGYRLEVPTTTYSWESRRGDTKKRHSIEELCVLTSSWQSPSGRVGHLLVNLAQEPQAVELGVDTRNAPAWPRCDVAMYSSRDGETLRPLWKDVELPKPFARVLEPLEIVFLEIREAEGSKEDK